jgi:hypothetical protein
MSLSPRRLLRPWLKKSFNSILSDEETISAVDYEGQQSKQNHGIVVAAQKKEEPQLGDLQEEIAWLCSIATDSSKDTSREQAEAPASDQRFKTSSKQVEQRQSFVSQQVDQESNAQESRDDDSSPFVHEIQYTYKADNRPMEDRDIKELFHVPPPDGKNLRTVQELLEGSDSLAPWLRDMLLEASVKVKQIPCTPNDGNVSKDFGAESSFLPLIRCESDDSGISASLSGAGEEGTTIMSSFSELSETMEDSANPCSWFAIYL